MNNGNWKDPPRLSECAMSPARYVLQSVVDLRASVYVGVASRCPLPAGVSGGVSFGSSCALCINACIRDRTVQFSNQVQMRNEINTSGIVYTDI